MQTVDEEGNNQNNTGCWLEKASIVPQNRDNRQSFQMHSLYFVHSYVPKYLFHTTTTMFF